MKTVMNLDFSCYPFIPVDDVQAGRVQHKLVVLGLSLHTRNEDSRNESVTDDRIEVERDTKLKVGMK